MSILPVTHTMDSGREQEGAELRLLDRGPGVYLSVGFLREDIKWSEGDIRAAV